MHLTENQIALDAMECVFRPGVQMFDHPFVVTISPERLASSIELAPLAYRDAFALAWDKGFGDSRISDLEDEARNLRMAADDAERRCTLARQNLVEEIAARQNAEGEVARLRRAFLEYQQAPVVGGVPEIIAHIRQGCHAWMPGLGRCGDREPMGKGQLCPSYARVEEFTPRLPALKPGEVETGGVEAIAQERRRQIEKEGWTADHDDDHNRGTLETAAICYAIHGVPWVREAVKAIRLWPWDREWWKPADHRRNLVKAGALLAAAIDKLDRRTKPTPTEKEST